MQIKKWITLGACALIPASFAGEMNEQDILKSIEKLQQQIEQQNAQIQMLKSQLNQQKTETEANFAQVKQASGVELGDNIDGLTLNGMVRFRLDNETIETEAKVADWATDGKADDEFSRNMWQTRLELGAVWENSAENFEVGVGIATLANFGTTGPGTSTDATWGAGFGGPGIGLDYAYTKHTWDCVSMTLGQQINPYKSTFIFWDDDVRPAGMTAQYNMAGFFATGGYYPVITGVNDGINGMQQDDAELLAAQLGYNLEAEGVEATIALAYYHFDGASADAIFGQTAAAKAIAEPTYQIGDLYGTVSTNVGDLALTGFGQVCKNFGADTDSAQGIPWGVMAGKSYSDEDMAWTLGVEGKFESLKLGYAYGVKERLALPVAFADNDFGRTLITGAGAIAGRADVKGHKISACYDLSKNLALGISAFYVEREETSVFAATDDDEQSLYQFDIKYKF